MIAYSQETEERVRDGMNFSLPTIPSHAGHPALSHSSPSRHDSGEQELTVDGMERGGRKEIVGKDISFPFSFHVVPHLRSSFPISSLC